MNRAGTDDRPDVLRLFDAKAGSWSEKYLTGGRLAGRLAELVQQAENRTERGARVLDLGCGSGDLARAIAAAGRRVTGCDISAEMLDRAEEADLSRSVRWIRLAPGWTGLPLDDGAFDLVVLSSVFEYVDDPAAVFRECARVLRPGGSVLCTVPDVRHPVRWLEWTGQSAALLPAVRALCGHWARLAAYLTYLRVSRQRHRAAWWQKTAGSGFRMETGSASKAPLTPLRLLAFDRRDNRG